MDLEVIWGGLWASEQVLYGEASVHFVRVDVCLRDLCSSRVLVAKICDVDE